jgi:hypothetical protein
MVGSRATITAGDENETQQAYRNRDFDHRAWLCRAGMGAGYCTTTRRMHA